VNSSVLVCLRLIIMLRFGLVCGFVHACTQEGEDVWLTGNRVSCCDGLVENLRNWDGGENRSHKCVRETTSPFEQYAAEYPDACKPIVRRSKCKDEHFVGLLIFFHGYSACASQVQNLAEHLSGRCMDVLAPTMPGHGKRPIKNCDEKGAKCTVRVGLSGFDLSELPVDARSYVDFVDDMNKLVRREQQHRADALGLKAVEFSVGGLSHGASMAMITANRNPGFYKRQLLINPSLVMGREEADEEYYECTVAGHSVKHCLNKGKVNWETMLGAGAEYLDMLLGHSDNFAEYEQELFAMLVRLQDTLLHAQCAPASRQMLDQMFDSQVTWGSVCQGIFRRDVEGRGGFCSFLQKHVLATQSFALHGLVELLQASVAPTELTQVFVTERDGMTRNGAVYALAENLAARSNHAISMCSYRFQEGWDRSNPRNYYDNEGSMPHANIDDARGWWIENLFNDVGAFLTGASTIPHPDTWDGSKEMCVETPLVKSAPQSTLFLPQAVPQKESQLAPDLKWWLATMAMGCASDSSAIMI